MTSISLRLAALVTALAVPAFAVGPELSVDVRCDTTLVGTGASVVVPISLRNGTGDDGQPNQVAALDLALTFGADAFEVTDVRLPAALAATDTWTLDWETSLGLPLVPGRVSLAIAPGFTFPVPTLPDGPVAEVVLMTRGAGSRCAAIAVDPASLVASSPPLGLALVPGPITDGGIAVTELCDDCADNDDDGLVDLADPDCGAAPVTFTRKPEKLTVIRKKNGTVLMKIRGSQAVAFADLAERLTLEIRPADAPPATCQVLEGQLSKRKGKKKKVFIYTGPGGTIAKLVSNPKKGTTAVTVKSSGLAVAADAETLSLSLRLGDERFHSVLRRTQSSKKKQTYK